VREPRWTSCLTLEILASKRRESLPSHAEHASSRLCERQAGGAFVYSMPLVRRVLAMRVLPTESGLANKVHPGGKGFQAPLLLLASRCVWDHFSVRRIVFFLFPNDATLTIVARYSRGTGDYAPSVGELREDAARYLWVGKT
jgi:hypothetical protein